MLLLMYGIVAVIPFFLLPAIPMRLDDMILMIEMFYLVWEPRWLCPPFMYLVFCIDEVKGYKHVLANWCQLVLISSSLMQFRLAPVGNCVLFLSSGHIDSYASVIALFILPTAVSSSRWYQATLFTSTCSRSFFSLKVYATQLEFIGFSQEAIFFLSPLMSNRMIPPSDIEIRPIQWDYFITQRKVLWCSRETIYNFNPSHSSTVLFGIV